MNDNPSTADENLVARVAHAFDRMKVPSAPPARQSIELIERAAKGEVREPIAPATLAGNSASSQGGTFWTHAAPWQRIAGGVTVSIVIVSGIFLAALNSGPRLSAMEQVARQLREVTSYSYQISSETTTADADQQTTWRERGESYWRAPDAFRGAEKIVKIETAGDKSSEEVLEDFIEIFPPDGLGVFIDHQRKTYFRAPFVPTGSRTYPLEPLQIIREDHPQPKRELGTRQIDGKAARGYLVALKAGFPPREHDWEVWVDPQTDLPLEIGYRVDDHKQPRTATVLRIDHFRWNVPLDAKLFEPKAPEGYREIEK